ncbi:gamma-glutamyltransferase family protein [Pseudooceanicola aestuarii]|uniref:gamma-glutamyltransferase family protein n=1 Tax=Pseudooceanicola aestuarii TaxID=2697319 RepID=UPI0013D599F8|nr:gamma-glutamyltransferase family protein [Pseudooceanicola aestuarii]
MRDLHLPGRSPVRAANGICATSHPLAAQEALRILQSGGNAMDAAIAGAVLLGVCEPPMCGLGGDLFALVSPAGGDDVQALNGSGRAPAGADAQALRDQGLREIPRDHPLGVTMPTAVRGFFALSERWGKLGMADSLAPAIRYFEEGVPIHDRVAFDWARAAGALNPAARKHFLPWGAAPAPGARFALPGQAEVLRRLAAMGPQAFYEGEVADDILSALQALGGPHTAADLANTRAEFTDPVQGHYQGLDVVEHPPNGQGATAILLLNILSQFDIAGMDPWGTARAHIEAEATKLAYDARNRLLSDPDYGDGAAVMMDPATARDLAAQIDPKGVLPPFPPASGAAHKDTVYITVVDRDRMAVSLIYSVFHSFGSGIGTEKFGLSLQNRGTGFNLIPGHPNELAPGKRPVHTIIPGMIKQEGRVTMPFGVMGGAYQATGHARFVSNLIDFGLSPQQAIDAPRAFAADGQLQVERGYADKIRQELAELGHDVTIPDVPIGGAQAIRINDDGMLEAGSDHRKDGCALGY